MKKRNIKLHLLYWLFIGVAAIGMGAVIMLLNRARTELLADAEAAELLDRVQLIAAIEQTEEAVRMAAHTASPSVYASKMQELAEGSAGAKLLTQQRSPASVWSMLWESLCEYAREEIEQTIAKASVEPDRQLLEQYADLLARLKAEPEALEGALWRDLPEELGIPNLQTEFSLGEETLKETAAERLQIGSGLLKKAESGLPGMVRYRCANAEVDLLVSGQLVYLDLELPRKEGSIGREECLRRLAAFADEEGYKDARVIDLYEHNGVLWAKMAPTVKLARFGSVKNLDRPLIAACTLWSGRVCHFEVKVQGDNEVDEKDFDEINWLSEKRLKEIAAEKNAELGEAVICEGRVCRTLTLRETDEQIDIHIYLDAENGSEREVALRRSTRPTELPAFWGPEAEGTYDTVLTEALPPYGDWQWRRYRSALLDG